MTIWPWTRTNADGSCRHRYRPRYDEKQVQLPGNLKSVEVSDRSYWIMKVYVRDVCCHCGDTVEREG